MLVTRLLGFFIPAFTHIIFQFLFSFVVFFSRKTGHNEISIIDNITPEARNSPTNSNRRYLVFSIHVMVHIMRIMYI